MDEQFHYQQYLSYFKGKYQQWNQKITTPPGLYHIEVLITKLFNISSISALRTINSLIFSNLFVVFVLKIFELKDRNVNNSSRALNLAITPTIFFFNFLNYTDSASLTFITMAFYYNLTLSSFRLSLCSLLAIYIRQNNIIWIVYLMCYKILNDYKEHINYPRSFWRQIIAVLKLTLSNFWKIMDHLKLQFLVLFVFFLYLKYYNNGKLTFGHEQYHSLSFHPTQLLYLSLFCFFNIPISLNQYTQNTLKLFQKIFYSRHSLAYYLLILSISLIIVNKITLVHDFILADNRHYTFYLYRYFFQYEIFRLALCLIYPICFIFLFRINVNSQQTMLKYILWLSASAAYLMISQLVQFRYFSIPLLIFSLQIRNCAIDIDIEKVHLKQRRQKNTHRMLWTNIFKIIINLIVFIIFLFFPFNNKYGTGRFMW